MTEFIERLRQKIDRVEYFLLLIIFSILPLVLKIKLFERNKFTSIEQLAFPLSRGSFDIFHYYKAIFLIFLSFLIVVIWFFKRSKFRSYYSFFPLLLIFFIVFSSLLSEYRNFTLLGGAESFQGILVWISYMVICLSAMHLDNVKRIKHLLFGFVVVGSFISIIGLIQFFGIDIWQILNPIISTSNFSLNPQKFDRIESVFYQLNYYGAFLTMLLLFTTCFFLSLKSVRFKIAVGIIYSLVFWNLLGSSSRVGFFASIFLLLTITLTIRKKNKAALIKYGFILGLSSLLFVGYQLSEYKSTRVPLSKLSYSNDSNFKDIIVKDSVAEILQHKGKSIFLKVKGKDISFYKDEFFKDGLTYNLQNSVLLFEDEEYSEYKFLLDKKLKNGIYFILGETSKGEARKYPLIVSENRFKTKDVTGKLISIDNFPKWNSLDKKNRLLNGRGMIWSLCLPILKDYIFLGSGADTFPLVFPNNARFDLIKTFGRNANVAAAHSTYFQIALQFGILFLIIFLAFTGFYICNSLKILWSAKFESSTEFYALGCFLAVTGYLINGIITAFMVSTAPIFFILLGLGISLNKKIKQGT